ncbi:Hermansky-Pudlak syndrome 1 protein homolog isoform X1 [Branchiostoma floridae]|uniref:Hermansky-Pudlak syndrome 1 protein homolog isoform X1 n=1 Tax=Branchiostoma floridae TaxID=7739 RepID=A0A9J7L2C7_BRAFL|nr:Hermansky-Pudlak syndrome 1 protein homolog isoform X1 [Branchiostoma floridae]
MKGLVVINPLPDIVFFWGDVEFTTHINRLGAREGIAEQNGISDEVDQNALVQFFSPLLASHRFLKAELDNPYSSISCENGFLFVLRQFGEHLHIAVCGDGSETEEFLKRKLYVFRRLAGVHYGPVIDELRPDSSHDRKKRWTYMSRLINTWAHLASTEQSFLVEAVERLNVNQALNETCINILEQALSKVRSGGDKHAVHALLLVNTKLLALYSSRNACELQAADILAITLVVRTLFPTGDSLEELLSFTHTPSTPLSVRRVTAERSPTPSSTDYYSPSSSVEETEQEKSEGQGDSSPQPVPNRDLFHTPIIPHEQDSFHTPAAVQDSFFTPHQPTPASQRAQQPEQNPLLLSACEEALDETAESSQEYFHMPAFLQTPLCTHSPHLLHCVPIMPGTVLVIVSEVPKSHLAGHICQCLLTLVTTEMLQGKTGGSARDGVQGRNQVEVLEGNVKRVLDATRKMKGGLERVHKDLVNRWDLVRKGGLLEYMDSTAANPPPRLETALSEFTRTLKVLFRLLFLTYKPPQAAEDKQRETMDAVQELVSRKISDYKDYLSVKAQRNVTMTTTYLEDFPGLIHFLYIDRSMDLVIAPAINVTTHPEPGCFDATAVLKVKVWEMVRRWQHYLQNSFTSSVVRDGDFCYSYFLWFEDPSGNPLSPQQPVKQVQGAPPGILAGHYYRDLCSRCFPTMPVGAVNCYELMCMHVGVIPAEFVASHCRKLAAMLWETSGEAHSPISLL